MLDFFSNAFADDAPTAATRGNCLSTRHVDDLRYT